MLQSWVIQNFTAWCFEIRNHRFELHILGFNLRPKGLYGDNDRMVVQLTNYINELKEVTFIGPDGSNMGKTSPGSFGELIGPKYSEVIELIERNAHIYGDKLILQWVKPESETHPTQFLTNIRVDSSVFEFKSDTVKESPVENHLIHSFGFNANVDVINLKISTKGEFKFSLHPDIFKETLIHTSFNYFISGILVNSFCDRTFHQSRAHVFPHNVPPQALPNFHLIISLKVIKGDVSSTRSFTPFKITPNLELSYNMSLNVLKNKERIDLTKLLSSELFSDFSIQCQTRSFKTHKAILGPQSSFFMGLFQSGMKEARESVLCLGNVDSKTVELLLTKMYGCIKKLSCHEALKLYPLASLYFLSFLKVECSNCLMSNISVRNAIEILKLAKLYEDAGLELVAKIFISKRENLRELDGFEELQND